MGYSIIGVIGHIDHGKTSLVAALTGKDTDTHPEEKRRGITIDLGFASFTEQGHQFALIDAPGHQKYIGNLLAGVSAIDAGLLVVACDQGIQAQTLEHASILHMLGVKELLVVLSRIDLASDETQAELREELELFLDDFGYHDTPMIPVSSVNGTGLPELKEELCRAAARVPSRPTGTSFRMPVDRVFTLEGRGCVIAGTVWSGSVKVGDSLELLRAGETVRVRDIQVHGETVEESITGCRTALNVAGVSASDVQRGDELLQPGQFEPSRFLLVELKAFKDTAEIKCPATMQIHIAATSCSARVTGVRRLRPSESAVVVVECEEPVVAVYGQNCLFRLPYPVGTVGGGTVLATPGKEVRRARRLIEFGEKVAMADDAERLAAWVEFSGELLPGDNWIERSAGFDSAEFADLIRDELEAERILQIPKTDILVSPGRRDTVCRHIESILTQRAEEDQDAWCDEESLMRQIESFGSNELRRWCLQQLIDDSRVVRVGRVVAIASDQNALSKKQQSRMQKIVEMFDGLRTPPTLKEISASLQLPLETVRSLSRFAVQTGMLLDLGNDFLFSSLIFRDLCRELNVLFEAGPRSVAEIRDQWEITRKHAIPLLEYCDNEQVTLRDENLRSAGPSLQQYL